MRKTVVLDVVGLTPALVEGMPGLKAWSRRAKTAAIRPALPAVTCTAQANYLTGEYPERHGIVGNGWYFRDECEIKFWRQSNRLVQAPKLWDVARGLDPSFTCANMFWWFNMYSGADYSMTPRPMYPADGRKLPDVYSHPADLRTIALERLGTFPLFNFWGPASSIASSRWIAEASKLVEERHAPTLTLVYLPHLDYALQKLGPRAPGLQPELAAIDAVCTDLITFYEERGAQVVVLSEYGITEVSRPIHLNRALRREGLLSVRIEQGLELLDAGASTAFAVADHQVAHVYVDDPEKLPRVRRLVEGLEGVALVLDEVGKRAHGLAHERAGELVLVSEPDAWFTYYYWLEDERAPDFARTVEIHRKPGYDPVELFLDPAIRFPRLAVAARLLKKALGFRTLMDVIPLDATLVRGSHGAWATSGQEGPLLMTRQAELLGATELESVEVFGVLLRHLFADRDLEVPGPRNGGAGWETNR